MNQKPRVWRAIRGNLTCTANDGGVAKFVGVGAGGVPLPPHLGGMRERCKLPHRGLGRSPRSSATILF